jgi:hypothetical protein
MGAREGDVYCFAVIVPAPALKSMHVRTWLRTLFGFILVSLLAVTVWASLRQPVWEWSGLTRVPDNGWAIATLLDAYYGFITFYVWVAYKEQRWLPRILWLIAILALGNMAMSGYVLLQLHRLPPGEPLPSLLVARNP